MEDDNNLPPSCSADDLLCEIFARPDACRPIQEQQIFTVPHRSRPKSNSSETIESVDRKVPNIQSRSGSPTSPLDQQASLEGLFRTSRSIAEREPAVATSIETLSLSLAPQSSRSPTKQDSSDVAARPRMNTDQIDVLENIYLKNPKPTSTEKEKVAVRLSVSRERVNNWFQNRRAKSKNQVKEQQRSACPDHSSAREQQWDFEMASFSTQAPFFPEHPGQIIGGLAQTNGQELLRDSPEHFGSQSVYGDANFHPMASSMSQSYFEQQQHGAQDIDFPFLASLDSDYSPVWAANSEFNDFLDLKSLAPEPQKVIGTDHDLLSMQSSSTLFDEQQQHSTSSAFMCKPIGSSNQEDIISSPSKRISERSESTSRSVSQHVSPQRSPSPSIVASPLFHPSHTAFPASSWSRRGSSTSELAKNFNTIQLQRGSSQQYFNEDVFKTPRIPDLNLAARRKRARPEKLFSARAISNSVAELAPSSRSMARPQSSVRRSRSTGNSLNVFGAQQSKPSLPMAQRSPLSRSFPEIGTTELKIMDGSIVDEQNILKAQNDDNSLVFTGQADVWSTDVSGPTIWAASPCEAPPLSASYTQASFDEPGWSASSPLTPFFNQPLWAPGIITQSAPAHINTFQKINESPPLRAQANFTPNINSSIDSINSFLAPRHETGTPLFAPAPMLSSAQVQAQIERFHEDARPGSSPDFTGPGSQHYIFYNQHNQQYSQTLSSMPLSSMAPVKAEQKELEIIPANFPEHKLPCEVAARLHAQVSYEFHNTGPQDYVHLES